MVIDLIHCVGKFWRGRGIDARWRVVLAIKREAGGLKKVGC